MENELKSVVIYSAAGIAAGILSGFTAEPLHGLIVAAAFAAAAGAGMKHLFKAPDYKWVAKNGLFSFILIWYVTFTILFNIGV